MDESGAIWTEQDFENWTKDVVGRGLILIGTQADNVDIPANGDKTVQAPFDIPRGYQLCAYRQISINSASTNPSNEKKVIVRHFGTANAGTTTNISLVNLANSPARVKVEVTALFKYDGISVS